MIFKINRVIGLLFTGALIYGICQQLELLPDWAPQLFPRPPGPPAA
jgi:hypothetical protein